MRALDLAGRKMPQGYPVAITLLGLCHHKYALGLCHHNHALGS